MPSNPCEAHRAIARFAESRPQSPALIDPDGPTLTYKEFWEQIKAISRRLEDAGFAPGERVATLLPQGPLQVLAVTGVMNHRAVQPLSSRATTADSLYSLRRVSRQSAHRCSGVRTGNRGRIGHGTYCADRSASAKLRTIGSFGFPNSRSMRILRLLA